jgi:hypothetical protein
MMLFFAGGYGLGGLAMSSIQDYTGDRNNFARFGFGTVSQYAIGNLSLGKGKCTAR